MADDINWNLLQQSAQPQQGVVAQLPTQQDTGISGLMSGLAGLVGHITSNPVQTNNTFTQPSTAMQNAVQSVNQQQNQTLNNSATSFYNKAHEFLGQNSQNPTLKAYLQKTNPTLDPTQTPWCAGFVGSVLNSSGAQGTGSLAAKSYLNYGQATKNPSQGDIVVFNDLTGRNRPEHGHVGFVDHIDTANGLVYTLGGNQSGSVNIKAYPLSSVAGFRIPPTGQQVRQFALNNNIQNPQQLSKLPIQQTNILLPHIMAGIAHVETGDSKNPYREISIADSRGNRSYGKYQISSANIPSWTKEALGHSMTPRQFLNDPQAQERTAQYHIGKYLQQYKNADDVYSSWFSGRPMNKAGNARDAYGTTVPQYINKAREGYRKSLMQQSMNTRTNEELNPPSNLTPQQYEENFRELDQGRDDYS